MNQQSAQGLAALGRGPDSMLVHMAPGEVKSLQQLAMAHGGSLTINPETGLPEAGFLSSLLPMLIGGGLSIASGGALTPLMSGLIAGGGYGVATGSLKKGLMAGLGAYGGAGLGSALAGAGGANLVAAGTPATNPGAAMAAGAGDATANIGAAGTMNPANFLGPATPSIEFANPSNLAGSSSPGMFGNAAANFNKASAGISGLSSEAGRGAFMSQIGGGKGLMQAGAMAAAPMMMDTTTKQPEMKTDKDMGQRYQFNAGPTTPTPAPDVPGSGNLNQDFGKEQRYFTPSYTPIDNDAAKKLHGFASGGPVEAMSNANAIGMNTGYPQSGIHTGAYTSPTQVPVSQNMIGGSQDAAVNPYTGEAQFAEGGISHLGDYSDGGRLLRGPGDGISDSIPAMIGKKQPARLADGEFVVPARIVSELGNGSTEAGARKLYAMMDRVQKSRGKTVGKGKIAANSRAAKHLPA